MTLVACFMYVSATHANDVNTIEHVLASTSNKSCFTRDFTFDGLRP